MARPTRRAGNLPAEATSFIGRRRELTEVRKKLTEARLVSLVGPGGVGKTRLRSEEHTSELQSQSNLVCRLLLEKKKNERNHQFRIATTQTDAARLVCEHQ